MPSIRPTDRPRRVPRIARLLFSVRSRPPGRGHAPAPVDFASHEDLLGAALTVARRA